jgi:hypothetical protein
LQLAFLWLVNMHLWLINLHVELQQPGGLVLEATTSTPILDSQLTDFATCRDSRSW